MSGSIRFSSDIDWQASTGMFYEVMEYLKNNLYVSEKVRERAWWTFSGAAYFELHSLSLKEVEEIRVQILKFFATLPEWNINPEFQEAHYRMFADLFVVMNTAIAAMHRGEQGN